MKQFQHVLTISAAPDRVSRLIAGVESWASLLPHVRSVSASGHGRWEIVCVWRWIPCSVLASSRSNDLSVEYRFQRWPGIRVSWQWTVRPITDGSTSVRLLESVVNAPVFCSWLVAMVNRDLSSSTLQMIQLLAEADEKAHESIER